MTKDITVRPRGDFVLIRRIKADKSLGGVYTGKVDQHRLFVEDVGPEVLDLKKGDRVLVQMMKLPDDDEPLTGLPMPSNLEHPLRDDLFLVKSKFVNAVVEGWE